MIEDKYKKVTFTEKTVEKLTWQALQEYKEFAQTLCIDDGKVFLGGEPKYGTETGVEPPRDDFIYPSVCKDKEFVGRIHSHTAEYEERPPFDKGSSNVDTFGIAKEGLNRFIKFPRLECVVSPTYDKQGYLNGVKMGCEHFERFTEDDVKQMGAGLIHHKDGREIEEKFDDEDIKWIKSGRVPRAGGIFASLGFSVRMANLKRGLEEEGFMSYDEFDVKCKREEVEGEQGRLLCDFKDETLTFE